MIWTPDKDGFWSDAAHAARMARGWPAGETICGPGSRRDMARNIQMWLPQVVAKHGIDSLVNAGAGDLNWWGDLRDLPCRVTHLDLIPRHPDVLAWDITARQIPACDAVLMRHVLIHFDPPRVVAALGSARAAGARFLIASQYAPGQKFTGLDCTLYDLRKFGLGEPLDQVPDAQAGAQTLALWRI